MKEHGYLSYVFGACCFTDMKEKGQETLSICPGIQWLISWLKFTKMHADNKQSLWERFLEWSLLPPVTSAL